MFPKKKKKTWHLQSLERDVIAMHFICLFFVNASEKWIIEKWIILASLPEFLGLVLDLYHCFNVFVFHFEEYVRRLVEIDVQVKTIIIKAELILEIPGGLDRKTFLRCEGQKHLASSPHKRGHKKRARNCCSFASQPTHKYTHAHTHSHAHTNGQQVSAVSKPL